MILTTVKYPGRSYFNPKTKDTFFFNYKSLEMIYKAKIFYLNYYLILIILLILNSI